MTEKTIIRLGQDPSPEFNQVRSWIASHYDNKEVMEGVKKEDDALDALLLGLLIRWMNDSPEADGFEIGVNERIGTVRMRLAQSSPRSSISGEKLLELGVSPTVIEAATVEGQPGKLYPRFDRVMDDRDRRPGPRAVK